MTAKELEMRWLKLRFIGNVLAFGQLISAAACSARAG